MKVRIVIFLTAMIALIAGCGGTKVTNYEESRITSMAWADDTLVAYSKIKEVGFIVDGIKRNPKQIVELWVAEVDPQRGKIDTTYRLREIPAPLGRIEFFPGGQELLYAAKDGVWKVDLKSTEREEFFTHPSFNDYPLEIDVGPGENYTVIVVDAEGVSQTKGLLDLFMVDTYKGHLVFHTDSLRDAKSFAWSSHDCISYITPHPWKEGKNRIMQFGVTDCIVEPSEMTEEEVLCNCPQPNLSKSGRWVAFDKNGKLLIKENSEG